MKLEPNPPDNQRTVQRPSESPPVLLAAAALGDLITSLTEAGYRVLGPMVRDGAIGLGEISAAADLPFGWGVELEPGGYRLRQRDDQAAFGHCAGPQSWKQFLHLAREQLWSAQRTPAGLELDPDPAAASDAEPDRPMALLGVRPCDLRAIGIQDVVLGGAAHPGSRYAARREPALIIAVNCTEPGATCFCASMGAGPGVPPAANPDQAQHAWPAWDLALTELTGAAGHRFLAEAGTDRGARLLAGLPGSAARPEDIGDARAAVTIAADRMGRQMPPGVRDLLARSYPARQWEDVATRCLACGNCTMACPTCFCTTVTETSDLDGDHAGRWQLWDSCFDLNFSFTSGGPVRASVASRYRQWLTHKLSTWYDQFGSSGCVGCGRCIVWCPVGIDITAEVAALAKEEETRP